MDYETRQNIREILLNVSLTVEEQYEEIQTLGYDLEDVIDEVIDFEYENIRRRF